MFKEIVDGQRKMDIGRSQKLTFVLRWSKNKVQCYKNPKRQINSVLNKKILDSIKLKVFADDEINIGKWQYPYLIGHETFWEMKKMPSPFTVLKSQDFEVKSECF